MYLKKFIRRTLLTLVLPVLVMLISYEYLYRTMPNAYKVKDGYLSHKAADIETLILGSSHTFFGIDPSYFSRPAFNAANVSQDLKYDWFILNKYMTTEQALKQIILPVSYFTFFGLVRSSEEAWRIRKYQIYMGARDYPFYDIRYNTEFAHLGDRGCLNYYLRSLNAYSCTALGMGNAYARSKRSPDWEKSGVIAANRHTVWNKMNSLNIERRIKENLSYLDSIMMYCHSKHVQLLLITPPTWHTYYENLNAGQLNRMYSLINQIVRGKSDVKYLNLLKDSRWNENVFYDADHLNEYGAQKLAEILDQYLNND